MYKDYWPFKNNTFGKGLGKQTILYSEDGKTHFYDFSGGKFYNICFKMHSPLTHSFHFQVFILRIFYVFKHVGI